MPQIRTLLVANRGEIARRIFRTCRELGIQTVAVYSEPDADAPFVREADEAVPLGGASPADSYLQGDRVIAAALLAGADAIHPGYGFLSESAGFARASAAAGLTFIGPTPDAIESMGSKILARRLMASEGVPVLPGAELADLSDEGLRAAAESIGWPVLIKASAGGGGRGMRVVRDPDELVAAIASARRESGSAFGDDTVFLERYIDRPRHIEIQIFGDTFGAIAHLNERECSIQRRYQKILEESPSPGLSPELRERMGAAAIAAGKAIGYVGAGTVEFIVTPEGEFFFLEVNTRLQVEHPVTELVTGIDLVALQIAVAEGHPLPPEVLTPKLAGWAIEARLYAEDPAADFMPTAGRFETFQIAEAAGVRVDSGLESGSTISTNYDPMLAKVIGYGDTRAQALRRLIAALRLSRLHGPPTNRDLLVAILEHPEFSAGELDTGFLERHPPSELLARTAADDENSALFAVAAALAGAAAARETATTLKTLPAGWRNTPSQLQYRRFRLNETSLEVGYRHGGPVAAARYDVNGEPLDIEALEVTPAKVSLLVGGVRRAFSVHATADRVWVDSTRGAVALVIEPRFPVPELELAAGSLLAPMPGTVVRIEAEPGPVVAGQLLLVLEAMKMERQIVAPVDGLLLTYPIKVGQSVAGGEVLAVVEAEPAGEAASS